MTDHSTVSVPPENDKFKRFEAQGDLSTTSPHRSDAKTGHCCHDVSSTGRNLIVCIDGTSNQFGLKNTNVIELYNLILKDDDKNQQTWYNSGIGTYARPSFKSLKFYRQVIYHKIDLAIAWDFERTVLAAYRWLSENYRSGDRIFLFGFSRGAFQVRVLSAMIEKVGLIHKGNEMQIPFAYELYADPHSDEPMSSATAVGSDAPRIPEHNSLKDRLIPLLARRSKEQEAKGGITMAQRFKRAFSRKDVKVHFVGAWDTVSSIGIARGKRMLPGTVDGMKHVCYFRHALALDERRVKFLPEYAYGGRATEQSPEPRRDVAAPEAITEPQEKQNDSPLAATKTPTLDNVPTAWQSSDANAQIDSSQVKMSNPPHTLEVWFAGTHSDIGGGNTENASMDRSRPPLRWMVFEAGSLGLRTEPFERDLSSKEQIEIKESLTWHWWLLEVLPFKRLTYSERGDGNLTTHRLHFGKGRKLHRGQKIHSSLVLSDKTEYIPKASLLGRDAEFWQEIRRHGLGEWMAMDLFDSTRALVERYANHGDIAVLSNLRQIAISVDGCQAVYEGVIQVLQNLGLPLVVKIRCAKDILTNLALENVKLALPSRISSFLSDLRQNNESDYQEMVKQFMDKYTSPCLSVLQGHEGYIISVAFSPNGKRIISGSTDKTLRMWDAATGKQVGEPFRGHTDYIRSVAFSPDGKCVISGSDDRTVRMWDSETGKQVGDPFQGHSGYVHSVAFFPDGRRMVSVSADNTVRLWNMGTGKQEGAPLQGHTDIVVSVAVSPDGKHIISGSADKSIRIWDAETRMEAGKPFQGHTARIWSVAFSPDGEYIVSGSADNKIRMWDVETGKQVGDPFYGHQDDVNSVAFSPNGKRIVSGSNDETVGIWDVETGKQVGERFRGHTHWVWSVALSPDGKRIVSGSHDRTIRIWDAET